ncbi:hypothetical protein EPN28_01120 [Patescibacteria group bacterium]|nr:MAG: hypothetical protein EPN28_01120 [Patescibacteria group bacterium]
MPILVLQRLALEAILDFFYWPFWWYSKGAAHAAKWCAHLFRNIENSLAPGLWLKNIFVPMYGQYDWQGRLVSFFMRLIQIIFRGIAALVFLLVCFGLFLVWLVLPVIVLYGLVSAIL